MQTITKDGSSCYLYDDSEVINIQDNITIIGNPESLIIGDINSINGKVYKNVTPPDDWEGNKYLFDGTIWTISPNYVPPPSQPKATGIETI